MNYLNYNNFSRNHHLDEFGIFDPLLGNRGDLKNKINAGHEKMAEIEDKITGDKPDYKGEGVAVWLKKDKNGKQYLSICVLGKINLVAFKYEPK